MKKGNAFDLHFVGTHFVSTVLHVYMYMYIYIGTCYKVRVDIYIYTPFQVDCFNFEHGFVLR